MHALTSVLVISVTKVISVSQGKCLTSLTKVVDTDISRNKKVFDGF